MEHMGQKLGQHFLINEEKLKKVADALEINEGDVVIEIGPGHGELTQYLLEAGARVTALERDKALIDPLNKKSSAFANRGAFEVIEGNALELLPMVVEELSCHPGEPCPEPAEWVAEGSVVNETDSSATPPAGGVARNDKHCKINYKIVGNIPYYITGYLLRVIESLDHKPTRVVMTIQKEVAERMCATVPHMNLLAASVRFWAEPVIVDIIPKKDFNPPPKVDSATVRLDVRQTEEVKGDVYYAFIKKIFTQPRKTIANNLAGKEGDKNAVADVLKRAGIDAKKRPQDLSMKDIYELIKIAL